VFFFQKHCKTSPRDKFLYFVCSTIPEVLFKHRIGSHKMYFKTLLLLVIGFATAKFSGSVFTRTKMYYHVYWPLSPLMISSNFLLGLQNSIFQEVSPLKFCNVFFGSSLTTYSVHHSPMYFTILFIIQSSSLIPLGTTENKGDFNIPN
jgi:hypothetical protein